MKHLKSLPAFILILAAASAATAADAVTVWRPSTGTWFTPTLTKQWGSQSAGDVPLLADMDGDGVRDFVLWRASTGTWYWLTSSTGFSTSAARSVQFGSMGAGDIPLVADMDGDGKADLTVWRASTGTWYWLKSSSGYTVSASVQWGNASLGDVPVPADFDGDGRSDLAVWRASTGTWYWLTSSSGYAVSSSRTVQWGNRAAGDVPKAADLDGDGKAEIVVWRASTGTWYWLTAASNYAASKGGARQWGNKSVGDIPMLADFDGDGRADLTVWRATTYTYFWLTAASGYSYTASGMKAWGTAGDTPLAGPKFRVSSTSTPTPTPTPDPTPSPSTGGVQLRVLQWNTHHGGYGTDGVYSPNRLATWAASFKPDVVMFNEIEKNDYWGNQDQPEVYKSLLQQKTGYTWYYVFAQEFGQWSANGKGNLILSRYPITVSDRYELVRNADRSIAMAEITVNSRRVTLMLTHLDPYDQTLRLAQAKEVTGWAAPQPENRVITGDMNAWPDQTSIAQFDSLYYDSWAVAKNAGTAVAFSGNTGETKSGRIDYIFYSKNAANLSVVSSQVYDTRDSNGVMPSDHRPVLTTFLVR